MKGNTYPNAEFISLKHFLPYEDFRTVYKEQAQVPHGLSEIAVQIEFSKKAPGEKNLLPAIFEDSMFVYGFIKNNENLKQLFTGPMATDYARRKIYLYDWHDKYLLLFENGSKTAERAFFVTPEEMEELLEKCRHPKSFTAKTV